MFTFRTTRAQNRVDLINENCCGLVVPGQVKEDLDKLFRIATPLAHNCRRTDIEKGRSAFCGHSLRKHCLTSTRRAEQENSLPGFQDALEEVRILHGHKYSFFQETFGV